MPGYVGLLNNGGVLGEEKAVAGGLVKSVAA